MNTYDIFKHGDNVYRMLNGFTFMLIFYHDCTNKTIFNTVDEVLKVNAPKKFSMLEEARQTIPKIGNYYEFIYEAPYLGFYHFR